MPSKAGIFYRLYWEGLKKFSIYIFFLAKTSHLQGQIIVFFVAKYLHFGVKNWHEVHLWTVITAVITWFWISVLIRILGLNNNRESESNINRQVKHDFNEWVLWIFDQIFVMMMMIISLHCNQRLFLLLNLFWHIGKYLQML